ncbi:hypothetical protein AMELA_G00122860 [Ameiurus melas]|uniref:Uncharacterized protein n=1 Tax=Ameiurus melas TaxID=219545 RepID=A0A7J6AM25_AMEME|nr:hypothetical protein AMELA_G00122860 [Ameiurus melas]
MNWHHLSLPKSSLPKPPLQGPSPSPFSFEEQKSSKLFPLSHSMPEYPYGLWLISICLISIWEYPYGSAPERGFML